MEIKKKLFFSFLFFLENCHQAGKKKRNNIHRYLRQLLQPNSSSMEWHSSTMEFLYTVESRLWLSGRTEELAGAKQVITHVPLAECFFSFFRLATGKADFSPDLTNGHRQQLLCGLRGSGCDSPGLVQSCLTGLSSDQWQVDNLSWRPRHSGSFRRQVTLVKAPRSKTAGCLERNQKI